MSWNELLAIGKENAQELRDEQARPPVACPDCGEPLIAGPDGTLFCRFDGWKNNH
jgi:hypothetical protein